MSIEQRETLDAILRQAAFPPITARRDRHKHSEEAFRLVRGILRGWA